MDDNKNSQIEQEFPITFDISKPKPADRVFNLIILLMFLVLHFKLYWDVPKLLVGILVFVLCVVTMIILLVRRTKDQPQFSVYKDKLVVKQTFGSLKEYPFDLFNGFVHTKRMLFEWFIVLPEERGNIHIHCLAKDKREELINSLKKLIEK